MRTLLLDETRRTGMGEAARRHAASFTWRVAGERFAALLSELPQSPELPEPPDDATALADRPTAAGTAATSSIPAHIQ